MGYAKLVYDTSNTNLFGFQVLHDIASVIAGNVNTAANLVHADKRLSYIKNDLDSNWIPLYPIAGGVPGPSQSNNSIVFYAPCENTNLPAKYVRIWGQTNTSNLSANANLVYNAGTSNCAIIMSLGSSATSNTTMANETYYYSGHTTVTARSGIVGSPIHLHWDQRHLIIYGPTPGNTTVSSHFAVFETTETRVHTYANTAPMIYWAATGMQANALVTTPANAGITVSQAYSSVLQPCFYNPNTAQYVGVYNVFSTAFFDANVSYGTADTTLGSSGTYNISGPGVAAGTRNSSGKVAVLMLPIFYHMYNIGYPLMFIKTISNVYRINDISASDGEDVKIGSNVYIFLRGNFSNFGRNSVALAVEEK